MTHWRTKHDDSCACSRCDEEPSIKQGEPYWAQYTRTVLPDEIDEDPPVPLASARELAEKYGFKPHNESDELMHPDDPALDATDGAHPAWWRGHDAAAQGCSEKVARLEAEIWDLGNLLRNENKLYREASDKVVRLEAEVAELREKLQREKAMCKALAHLNPTHPSRRTPELAERVHTVACNAWAGATGNWAPAHTLREVTNAVLDVVFGKEQSDG